MSRRHGHSVVTKTGIGRSDHAQPLSILPLAISTIEKKSPPLTRSYPTCPSAKRPIPSRATSGYYKALEPFGPRSGTFWQPLSDGPAHAPGGLPQVELARRKVLLQLLSGRLISS